jgi:hypothetical protein
MSKCFRNSFEEKKMLAAASSINHNLVKRENGCAQTGSIRKADINVIRKAAVAKRATAVDRRKRRMFTPTTRAPLSKSLIAANEVCA